VTAIGRAPQLEGLKMVRRFQPDVLHVTSPSQIALVSSIVAKLFKVPLVLTYHTHLPVYAERYLGWVPGIVDAAWTTLRFVHSQADLTLVTSPQLQQEFRDQVPHALTLSLSLSLSHTLTLSLQQEFRDQVPHALPPGALRPPAAQLAPRPRVGYRCARARR
jgi:hypothetical protein